MILQYDNNPQGIFDKHFTMKCPQCGVQSNISAISIPRYEFAARFQPPKLGIAYRCDSCNGTLFLRFPVALYEIINNRIVISDEYEEVERPQETFEFNFLPKTVADDFREALICYSNSCFNAFAAMCRRSIQSSFQELGAEGKDKVLNQLQDVRDTAAIDEETFDILKQIIIAGHDGAHPHLPPLSPPRAAILLELMKDVLYQLFVRKQKIRESIELRKEATKKQENRQGEA